MDRRCVPAATSTRAAVTTLASASACAPALPLRSWQREFLERFSASSGQDFLLVASPGAGKTVAACQAAVSVGGADQVIVVTPTVALRAQWADAADGFGLHLDPRWRNADGAWPPGVDGVVVTYQQVASAPDLFAHHLRRPA